MLHNTMGGGGGIRISVTEVYDDPLLESPRGVQCP